MSDRAFVCICVDGQSDIDALKVPFEDLFDRVGQDCIDVKFRFAVFQNKPHGDITSMAGVTPENIEKTIYKYYFKNVDKRTELGWDDVTTIIHIIDLDGAYVPSDKIMLFTDDEKAQADALITSGEPKNTLYLEDHIAVRTNLSKRQETLLQKRKNIEYLLTLDEITVGKKKVRYFLYFFSCNIDHFLHGNANMIGTEKMRSASNFSSTVMDADSLVAFFQKTNSVQRWTMTNPGKTSAVARHLYREGAMFICLSIEFCHLVLRIGHKDSFTNCSLVQISISPMAESQD